MPSASTDSILEMPGDCDIFLSQLPQRLAAIEENWASIRNAGWQTEAVDKLYRRVREISEASSRFGLYQLNETVFSVEVYLSSFVGADKAPADNQLDAIEGLLRNLRATATESAEGAALTPAGQTADVYVLGSEKGDLQALGQALGSRSVQMRFFDNAEDTLRAMDAKLPGAMVADTAMLPKMSRVSDELKRLKTQASIDIPLVFVSASSNLQLRVDAIRAGSDAYFVSPIDADDVAQRILQLKDEGQDNNFRIMVVEDDPTQAEFASSILRKADMEVVTVTEPMRVLEMLRTFMPDLILMDIYMPEVNGIELTTIIREYNEFVGIPIVFLSGEQNTDKQMDALSVGGDDFVPKPIRPKHLLTVVQNRIRRARRLLRSIGAKKPHDQVTGLLSAHQFIGQIAKVLEADPMHAQPSAVLSIAPDGLEQLRDTHGLGGLDQLVGELGRSIRTPLDDKDAAARLDDHTLGILVRRASNNQIHDLCARLHEHVAASSFQADGSPVKLSIGIGVCLLEEGNKDPNGLVKRAEDAMQKAQDSGSNQTQVHTPNEKPQSKPEGKDGDIVACLKRCLDNDNFVVRYQPLLDLQTRGRENYEIIMRLPTPKGDQLRERDFRDAAEAAGLAGEVDRWLLDRAIEILKKRRDSGRQTHIFVHQSGSSVCDPNHPAWLLGRLRSHQMVGSGLILDFRLSDMSRDIRAAQKNIAALREFDVQVSLSRFPEKDAAFKVLRFVKANYISIAPRLLKADRDTITRVIDQSHRAGAKVIVSNIDDARSIDLHWSSGADFLQGKFIQRPLDNMDYDFSQVVI